MAAAAWWRVREDLPPWRGLVLPVRGAEGVVELPAGTLAGLGVRVGDEVVLEAEATPDAAGGTIGLRR